MGVSTSLVPAGGFSLTYRPPPGAGDMNGWFGPLNPMSPTAPASVKGRILDYPSGYNLQVRPRAYEGITFPMLRQFADTYDLLRILIETRKDQMARLDWNIVARDKKLRQKGAKIAPEMEARINGILEFFLRPDRENFWGDWLRLLLEDLFVVDAPSIYRVKTYGDQLYALQPIDGTTIKRVIDDFGNTPPPGEVAYQQILKGYPAVEYTTEELLYRPRVKRTHKIYGYSPVEQIVMTINIGMRRQVWQLQSFTEGNIPEALIGTPATWTPDQVKQFQDWFDSMLTGNTGEKRRARFVPGDVAKGYVPTKPAELFGEAEEWLVRVMCYAFNVSPQPFVKMMNRATAETAQETAVSEGLAPVQNWVKGLMDTLLIDDFGSPDLEFVWQEEDELDPDKKSQIIDREQAAGRLTYNEARREQGLDPFEHPDADRPMFKAATGWTPIFLTPEEQAAKDAAAQAMQDALGADAPPGGEGDGEDGPGGDDPPGASKLPVVPPAGAAAIAAAAAKVDGVDDLAKQYNEDQERDDHGRFAGGGDSGGEGRQEGESHRQAYDRQQAKEYQNNAVKAREDHAKWKEQNPTATTGQQIEHYRGAEKTHDGERMKAYSAGLKEANARDKAERANAQAMKGVAKKSDVPFHIPECGCNLVKVGRASSSNPTDPLRPFAAKHEKRVALAMKDILAKLGKSVAKQVEDKLSEVAKAEYPDDFDIDALLESLDLDILTMSQTELEEAMLAVRKDGGRLALSQIGTLVDDDRLTEVINERALIWASERAAELVSFGDDVDPLLAASTRDMIRATIADGIENNLSMPDIGAALEEAYAFSEDRALLIAATEITSANSEGALDGYKVAADEGVKLKKSWLVLEDGCPICTENADAGAIDLDEDFPSGDAAPGAHPNCRCVLVPEVEDDQGNVTEGDQQEGDDTAELAAMPYDLKKEQERAENGQFGSGGGDASDKVVKEYEINTAGGKSYGTADDIKSSETGRYTGSGTERRLESQTHLSEERVAGVEQRLAEDKDFDKNFAGGQLEKADMVAVAKYTGAGSQYKQINAAVRSGEPGKHEKTIQGLDRAIAGEHTKEDISVFRGVRGLSEEQVAGLKEGSTLTDKGFQSTTWDRDHAENFAAGRASGIGSGSKGGVLLEVNVEKGANALNMHDGRAGFGSNFKSEREVILPRDTTYHVTGTRVEEIHGVPVTVVSVTVKGDGKP